MNKLAKIIVTVIIIVIFFALFGVLAGVTTDNGGNPGVLGIILFAGLIGGLTAVWRKKKE